MHNGIVPSPKECLDQVSCAFRLYCHTVFHQMNVPGVEAKNEPLSLSDFDETNRVTSQEP